MKVKQFQIYLVLDRLEVNILSIHLMTNIVELHLIKWNLKTFKH